jgi:hypothetical protein
VVFSNTSQDPKLRGLNWVYPPITEVLPITVFFGKILPNFNMKNMILAYTKGFFMEKKWPKS